MTWKSGLMIGLIAVGFVVLALQFDSIREALGLPAPSKKLFGA